MKKSRQVKIISIVSLVIAIFALTLGFAAFSNTLNISSSATVKPSKSDFKVELSPTTLPTDTSSSVVGVTTGATAANATISSDRKSITGLTANFTEPGQSVIYTFYAHNKGEYDAYLEEITYVNLEGDSELIKYCTIDKNDNTTSSLVSSACNDIKLTVNVGDVSTSASKTVFGHKLAKNSYETVRVIIEYASNGTRADGPFSVAFGDISLQYSTVDNAKEILFEIAGTTYTTIEGMTWKEWVDSSYNTTGFYYNSNYIFSSAGEFVQDSSSYEVGKNDIILQTETYLLGHSASPTD